MIKIKQGRNKNGKISETIEQSRNWKGTNLKQQLKKVAERKPNKEGIKLD